MALSENAYKWKETTSDTNERVHTYLSFSPLPVVLDSQL